MRCHAYVLPSEVYRDLEAQILEQIKTADREQLMYLVEEHDLDIELLSGEWRLLFDRVGDFFQEVNVEAHTCRMAVSPDELSEFVEILRDPELRKQWAPVTFGLDELADALPAGVDLAGVVFIEESDDWMWTEHPYELMAIRPEVFDLLAPHMRALAEAQEYAVLARLCADHCEGSVEFAPERWNTFLSLATDKVPELLGLIQSMLSFPGDYPSILEALSAVADPAYQPSLDAWLRVHARQTNYALFFRDIGREKE